MDFLENKTTLPAMPVPPQFPGSEANPMLQAILDGVNELREKAVTHEALQKYIFRTVLGPPLWNIFFREIDDTIRRCLFRVSKFADDLTAYRNYVSSTSNSQILDDLKECQLASHQWGSTRRVSFDVSK